VADRQLSRPVIVTEALRLLEEVGLEDLSLRKVAASLGVKAPSLYWHIADKDDLRAAMGERLLRDCLGSIPPSEDWQSWLRAFGLAIWRAQETTRDAGALLMSARSVKHAFQGTATEIVSVLGRFGLDEVTATRMHWSVQALVTGWAVFGDAEDCEHSAQVSEAALDSLDVLILGWATRQAA
jgi:TetR/AcrR family tetracycline transcriptional repressor